MPLKVNNYTKTTPFGLSDSLKREHPADADADAIAAQIKAFEQAGGKARQVEPGVMTAKAPTMREFVI